MTNSNGQFKKDEIHVLWLTAGLGCEGESVAITNATQPSLEDVLSGAIPNLPRVIFHHPYFAMESGDEFLQIFHQAANGEIENFILVVEGSMPNEQNKTEGYWAAFGADADGNPITTCAWVDQLVQHAWAVVAIGTCAAYGGVHAMPGNPTDCMGLPDYLGAEWKSKADIPVVCIGGCPAQPDNMMQTFVYLFQQFAGNAPMIPLDDALRPAWIFADTLHENCDRGGYYEQAQFADGYGEKDCIVKIGCWGPVVQCNVGKRGWTGGVGGCANVGGICIGCTMPGFPEKFQPFMAQPPGSLLSSQAISTYGNSITALRRFTQNSLNQEPAWRQNRTSAFVQIQGLPKK